MRVDVSWYYFTLFCWTLLVSLFIWWCYTGKLEEQCLDPGIIVSKFLGLHAGLGEEGPSVPYPRILRPTGGAHFARVAAGAMHSLGLTSAGQVYAWGDGSFGALGARCQSPGSFRLFLNKNTTS